MTCKVPRAVLALAALLMTMAVPSWPQSKLDRIKSDYSTVSSQLEKHIVDNWWIDDDPQSPETIVPALVARRRVGRCLA
jgi:hypothetical protein